MKNNGDMNMHQNTINKLMMESTYKNAPRRLKKLLRTTDIRIDIEVGWYNIIEDFLEEFNKLNTIKIELIQIKQKLGGLRIYYSVEHANESEKTEEIIKDIDKLISKYESKAEMICELCGKPKTDIKKRKKRYWIYNCCEDCFDKKEGN